MVFAFDIVPVTLEVDRTSHRRTLYDTPSLYSSAVPPQQCEHGQHVGRECDRWNNSGDERFM